MNGAGRAAGLPSLKRPKSAENCGDEPFGTIAESRINQS
jgi:hypothetical protein